MFDMQVPPQEIFPVARGTNVVAAPVTPYRLIFSLPPQPELPCMAEVIGGVVGWAVSAVLRLAGAVYLRGPSPEQAYEPYGYPSHTRAAQTYRLTWSLGRLLTWATVVGLLAVLAWMIYLR